MSGEELDPIEAIRFAKSISLWKSLFYPVHSRTEMTREQAVIQSIRKFVGLSERNLNRFDLVFDKEYCAVRHKDDNGPLKKDCGLPHGTMYVNVDTTTCALCYKYAQSLERMCHGCPLFMVRNGNRCDMKIQDAEDASPYEHFTTSGDTEPMLSWLLNALVLHYEKQEAYHQ